MELALSLILLMLSRTTGALPGHFWHLTDLHLDPNYTASSNPLQVCPSAGSQPVPNAGKWGDYLCDSPWILINSSVYAMKNILPDPDFILWTGDDTPHVADEKLGEDAVLSIVEKLTTLIKEVFPDTKVYPALGNHDFHPKNQLPAANNSIYRKITQLWGPWLNVASIAPFERGAFYSEQLVNKTQGGRVIVLNTNLYYKNNDQTTNMDDPGGQFKWLEEELTSAANKGEKVYIVGHIPPGMFEKKRSTPWFREHFNKRYVDIIQKHHGVIAAQFFGHHHTDTFRMIHNSAGSPISALFIAPGVTPWKTTLPGVQNGANNPGIRVFDYDRNTLQVKDMVTYYLNLTYSNLAAPRWEKEYRLTEAFKVPDGSTKSMQTVLDKIATDKCYLQKYYEYNSVRYDLVDCDMNCRADHVCAIREVDFTKYESCIIQESSSTSLTVQLPLLIFLLTCFFTFL
ncbi:acid sphingomyelinase-like phosphodiesterase 3b isoform X1 [Microcaecilia unicolor]|uniref:Acid sphingomyelinase-like phosphodiesterase n=2 Tax=Microcaecilia unicolor TaxID=1415580 RepID=A0A6P7Z251_9AMPH|nr:acid sphingomyelinase-like phosphodiesterase 3b isoform X1 [Microcaecilia unicolor]